jgi:hypothetical protein
MTAVVQGCASGFADSAERSTVAMGIMSSYSGGPGRLDERRSPASAPKQRQQAHSHRAALRNDIAPADDVAACDGDKLRVALRDILSFIRYFI